MLEFEKKGNIHVCETVIQKTPTKFIVYNDHHEWRWFAKEHYAYDPFEKTQFKPWLTKEPHWEAKHTGLSGEIEPEHATAEEAMENINIKLEENKLI